jgi:Bacterial Ig domain
VFSGDNWGGWNFGDATPAPSGTAYVIDNNDGTITFNPNNDANGIYSFTYTLNTSAGTVNAVATIGVQSANPVAVAVFATTQIGNPVNIFVVANDFAAPDPTVDWGGLQLRGGQPANGVVSIINPVTSTNPLDRYFTYTPNLGFTGTDTFQYRVQEDGTNSNTVTVTVTVVNAVNAINDSYTVLQNSAEATLDVLTNGIDDSNPAGGPLTISAVSAGSNGGIAYINDTGTGILYAPAHGLLTGMAVLTPPQSPLR